MKVTPAKTVGKPHKPAKPRKPSAITKARTKHAKAKKHHAATKKHAMTAHQKHLAHLAHLAHIHRGLAIGAEVACCAAEALAASLRLLGCSVDDEDVLDLYWHTASTPDAGASILATLTAASEFGLAGIRPGAVRLLRQDELQHGHDRGYAEDADPGMVIQPFHGLILGVDLPGPHTVLATPEGWWTWGDLRDPAEWPDAVIEEAWAVTWG